MNVQDPATQAPTGRRRGSRLGQLVALLAVTSLVIGGVGARADSTAATDDKSVSVPTSWWTYTNVTNASISSLLTANGARLTDLEVYSASSNTFTVTMVRNTGAYAAPSWWWYFDATAAQLQNLLTANNARLIDIEAYDDGGVIRYAAVMVTNTGTLARTWKYGSGLSQAGVTSAIGTTYRLVDLESYVEAGVKKYAYIAVLNSGADAKAWEWWVNQPFSSVASRVNTFAGRLTSLERQADGTYNMIQVKNAGADNKAWRYYGGFSSLPQAVQVASQFGMRIFDVETYLSGTSRRYDVVMMDNVNAPTRRITNLFSPTFTGSNGIPRANFGVYVKQIGGSASTNLLASFQYEPASSIKAVHNLHVMRRVAATTDDLSSSFTYYNYPNSPFNANTSNACPIPTDEVPANLLSSTLDFGKDVMMTNSDNRTTRGVVLRYGLSAINATAQMAGMASTQIDQDQVGCGWLGGKRNRTTLGDLGKLYELVENGALLGTSTFRTEFYQPMNGNTFNGEGSEASIQQVVSEEAAKQNKSAVVGSFIAGMNWRHKGGSYNNPCSQGGCSVGQMYFRSLNGRLTLPIKTSPTAFGTRTYVFGRFVDSLNIGCTGCVAASSADTALANVTKEMFREIIASALQTW